MNIIFATKNKNGFDTMKSNMYKISQNLEFEYHTRKAQLSLFGMQEYTDYEIIKSLAKYIYDNFRGKKITCFNLIDEIKGHPQIPSSFTKKALHKLEQSGKIIDVIKIGGSARRKNSFPENCIIKFK